MLKGRGALGSNDHPFKTNTIQILGMCIYTGSRPRWSRGNVIASRSKVRGLKSMDFFTI